VSQNLGRVHWRYTINISRFPTWQNGGGFSDQFFRDLFKDEPGVIKVLRPEIERWQGWLLTRVRIQADS
jgi:hypothetical protein